MKHAVEKWKYQRGKNYTFQDLFLSEGGGTLDINDPL